MRTRLRPKYSPEEMEAIYANPWRLPLGFKDHSLRIASTIAVANWFLGPNQIINGEERVTSVADLSCGDAAVTEALDVTNKILGDFGLGYEYTGPIEETITKIDPVDLFICGETLEHLDDPDATLRAIREKTRYLVASSPIGETNPELNPEHYWGWDTESFGEMLSEAGFEKVVLAVLEIPPPYIYHYQIWGCK